MKIVILTALFLAHAGAQTIEPGKKQYQARCVGCHGDDGTGGGHGPGIVGATATRAATKEAVRDVIRKGIPNTGMPAFAMSDEELDLIATYVMALKTPAADVVAKSEAAPGDRAAGERFFAGKGNCMSCHMVRGRGGVLGPDLSNIGRDRTRAQIEQALRDPAARQANAVGQRTRGGRGGPAAPSYRAVTVRLRNGRTIRGIANNESAFGGQ